MKRLKILLLVKHFQFGGAENHVCELANSLTDEGHRVWLMSEKGCQTERLHPDVQHRVVAFSDYRIIFHLIYLFRFIRKEKIDLIHAHQRYPIFLGTLVGRLCRIPAVATVHGSPLHDLKSRLVHQYVSKVICIRESCYVNLMKSPILGTKLELIPNGINLPAIPVLTPSSCRGFTLFYISRLDHRHAQLIKFILSEVWPEVVKRNPDALFHLIGDGSGLRQIQDFHQSKRFSPYRETVKFKGYCRQVPINYPNADLVLGVGRVAIESMIYGIPVLSVKYNHLGKIIIRENFRELMFSNFVDLKAEAPSKKEMVDALFDFIDRKEYYSNEARLLQHAAIQEFNQVEIVKRIVGVYQQTLA